MENKIKSTNLNYEKAVYIKRHYLREIMYTALDTHTVCDDKNNEHSILNNLQRIKTDAEYLIDYIEKSRKEF